jgi:hypothetical protein
MFIIFYKQQRLALKIAHLQGKGMEKIEDMEEGEKFADAMARANSAVNTSNSLYSCKNLQIYYLLEVKNQMNYRH